MSWGHDVGSSRGFRINGFKTAPAAVGDNSEFSLIFCFLSIFKGSNLQAYKYFDLKSHKV